MHRIKDLRPGLASERVGLRVTDPVRTVIDLGLVMPWWLVHRAIAKGISTKALTVSEVRTLRDALGRPGRNGTGIVRAILDGNLLVLGKEESDLEKRFTQLAKRRGLPPLSLQHEVWEAGRFVARVDAAYPELKLAIEVDGFEHHSTPDAFQYDRRGRTTSSRSDGRCSGSLGTTWFTVRHRSHSSSNKPLLGSTAA